MSDLSVPDVPGSLDEIESLLHLMVGAVRRLRVSLEAEDRAQHPAGTNLNLVQGGGLPAGQTVAQLRDALGIIGQNVRRDASQGVAFSDPLPDDDGDPA